MGGSTSNALSKWGGAQTAMNTYGNTNANLSEMIPPEQSNIDFNALNTMAKNQAFINDVNSRNLEQSTDPTASNMRKELETQVNSDLNEKQLPPGLQEQLARAGVEQTLMSGVGPSSGPGNSLIARLLGTGYLDYRNQNQQKAGAWLAGNPLQQAGIDPGSYANMNMEQNLNNLNLRNALLSRNDANRQQRYSDSFNQMQQMMGATAQQGQYDAAAKNQRAGTIASGISSGIGAVVGAAGAVAL